MIPLRRSPELKKIPSFRAGRSSHGAALVLVLTLLVLATFLVMAFFGTVSSEFGAAKIDSDVEAGRQLADTTVQIAMGQIRTATSTAGTAWASQPGMIRTYSDSGQSDEVFALYSTAQMRRAVSGGAFDPADDLPGSSWVTDEALWTDLNAPVETRSGGVGFPIIDPRAAAVVSAGVPLIEGFSYETAGVAGAVAPADLDDADARLPMPVRWIYVLRDGTLTVPLSGSGTTAEFVAPEPVPTDANPIVGRIAFWTDDETSKLNINTALGGVPWDTPIGNSGLEMLFARYQPAKNEFSRYPGHPASVSLAPVFWSFLGMSSPSESLFPTFTPNWNTTQPMASGPTLSTAVAAFRDAVFPFVPRNSWGGSAMASRPTLDVHAGAAAIAAVDSDRLFATVDETQFGPFEGDGIRDANPLDIGGDDVRKLSFFLTAQSRAPEVNMFNLPKISLWPLPDAARRSVVNANAVANDTRSAIDRLIAFCTTLAYDDATKKREYAFTRYDASSPTNDYLATDAYGTANNAIIYNYLGSLLGRSLPGFGGSFFSRYGEDGSYQILTGVYDFIRSQINLLDTSHSADNPSSSQNLVGSFVSRYAYAASISGSLVDPSVGGRVGQVIPASLPNGTRGSGRFPVVSQVALQFIARATNQPPTAGSTMHPSVPGGGAYPTIDIESDAPAAVFDLGRADKFHTHPGLRFLTIPITPGGSYTAPNPRYRGPDLAEHQTEIEATFLASFSLPAAGVPGYRHPFRVRVRGLGTLRANGSALFPSSYDSQIATVDPGGSGVWQFNLGPSKLANATATGGPGASAFFVGNPVVVGTPGNFGETFPFDGGSVVIELLHPDNDTVIQTYTLDFPAATFPTPKLPNAMPGDARNINAGHSFWSAGGIKPAFPPESAADLPPSTLLTFDPGSPLATTPNFPANDVSGYAPGKTRRSAGSSASFSNLILPEWPVANDYRGKLSSDTVRSLEAAYGDVRLLTQLASVPSGLFLPHRFYFDGKMRAAHSFRDSQFETQFEQMHGATFQYLTKSSETAAGVLPGYGGAWSASDPDPGNLWDVATGEDVKRLTYNRFVMPTANLAASTVAAKWPFTASTAEFSAGKFSAYQSSDPVTASIETFSSVWDRGGDFTSGMPGIMDGAMLGKLDEGNNRDDSKYVGGAKRGLYPYFNELATTSIMPIGPNLFSPNRQVPSPVVLGSVPAGFSPSFELANPELADLTPWRTLLFSPNPVSANHEALVEVADSGELVQSGTAPDFTLLDFFWMPIVEPYAISEPLSTAGKVNMNSQIAPFTYITRNTALRGVFQSTLVTAVPDKWIDNKNASGAGSATVPDLGGNSASIGYANFRYPINAAETLKQFQARFDAGDIFRSASEICSLWLYPDRRSSADVAGPVWDAGASNIRNWWYGNPGTESKSVTGDNLREKPYATLYPLLTTKSNTYTVHFKVQALQKVPGTQAAQWVENRDRIASEYQGSQTIERYIDPTDRKLIDFASETTTSSNIPNLGDFYRFRVLANKRFTP